MYFVDRAGSVLRRPWLIVCRWYIYPWRRCLSNLVSGTYSRIRSWMISIRRWCLHGVDVLPLAVDGVRRQYQAELVFVVGFGCYYGRSRCNRGSVSKSTTVGNNVVNSFMSRGDQFISGLVWCVYTILLAYFGGYDTFAYSSGYGLSYLFMLRCWGYQCSGLWKVSRGSSVHR